jgi:selenocysteine lyase/cysteine desulfurase
MDGREGGFSRRDFLGRVAGGSTAAALGLADTRAVFARTLQSVRAAGADGPGDSGYWERVRKQFMLEEGFAYLNTGTLGPTPRPVWEAMNEYWRLMAVNPNENSAVFQNHVEQIRVKVAGFFGATPDEIAITRNTTEGNTILCQGLDLEPGSEILITAYEHASNRETQMRHAKRRGLVVKEVQFPMPPASPQVIIDAFAAAITPKTRVMHFGNPLGGYGCIMPTKQLAELAHSRKILCFVDGAHAAGMFQFNLTEWGVDGFACNSHKWLCGAAGSGVLFVKRDVQERVAPVMGIHREEPAGARKYDQLSRRPWPTVMAFEDILDFHTAIGAARIEARARALGSYLRSGLAAIPKVKVYTPMDAAMSCGTTTAGIEGVPGAKVREYLRQKYDAYVPGGADRIRVSTHYFNTYEQADRVLSAYRELASGAA